MSTRKNSTAMMLVDGEGQGLLFPQDKMSTLRRRVKELEAENRALQKQADMFYGAYEAATVVMNSSESGWDSNLLCRVLDTVFKSLVDHDVYTMFIERYDDVPF